MVLAVIGSQLHIEVLICFLIANCNDVKRCALEVLDMSQKEEGNGIKEESKEWVGF